MAGRRPKPTSLKLVAGNPGKRAIPNLEPKPMAGPPVMPRHLTPSGKAVWKKVAGILSIMNVLTTADGLALERLCDCYADILECRKLVVRDGRTYKVETITGETLIKGNPAVNQLRAADAQFKSYLVEFGLTPAARSKVHATPDDDDKKDPLSEFFG